MAIGFGEACPKPEPRKRAKARKKRETRTREHDVRDYVFMRERNICRCCRARAAHSMHELVFRSLGGKVSRRNSVAVCGSGTTLCHGLLQSNQIAWSKECFDGLDAEDTLRFRPRTELAAAHLKIKLGESIISPVMRDVEAAV